jgi:lipid II:glycine glycyltransferase (peptidoglycan interpeptide bridge formation enzyme)
MLNWQLWNGTAKEWDSLLQQFEDYTIYQSNAWGEHRSRFNWSPIKLIVYEGGDVSAMAQILVKKYPFNLAIVWIPGGPIGDMDFWGSDLQSAISSAIGARYFYCRFSAMCANSENGKSKSSSFGWRRSSFPLNSGQSMIYKPSDNEDARQKQCSGNWRHNLRRSFKRGLLPYVWQHPDPNDMMRVYLAMQDHKQLSSQTSYQEIESLMSTFGEHCILVRCDDENGELLAFRGALVQGRKAWDIFAAATPAGRKVYASHATFWELMKQCAERKVQWYDMSGVDPSKNPGVYNFKKGTGAYDLNYLGEWDYAKPSFIGFLANRIIARRGRT